MTKINLRILRSEILGSEILVLGLGSGPGSGPGTGPGPPSDWSQDRLLRISNLRYTGFKGLSVASDNLSSDGPRIG